MMLVEGDVIVTSGMVVQRVGHGLAGSVGSMDHAAVGMAAFACQVQFPSAGIEDVAAEGYPEFLHPLDVFRAMLDSEANRVFVTEAATDLQGV